MLLNYTLLSQDNLQNNLASPIQVSQISTERAMFDELYINNILSETGYIENNGNKQKWDDCTILKAEFYKDFEAGNFSGGGFNVTSIKFKRKRADEFNWTTVCHIPYDSALARNYFYIQDKVVENQVNYDYAISAVYANRGNVEGIIKRIGSVKCEFEDCYIFDSDSNNYYKLSYNFTQGAIDIVIPNSVVNLLGDSQYPIVLYNSDTKYRKGSIQCYLFADINADTTDIRRELQLRNQIMNFLCNKKPKIIKAEDGTYMLINITETPQLIPNGKKIGLYQVSFKFVECGDIFNEDTLMANGFIETQSV